MKEGVGGLILKHVREDFICNTEYLRELEMVMMGVHSRLESSCKVVSPFSFRFNHSITTRTYFYLDLSWPLEVPLS